MTNKYFLTTVDRKCTNKLEITLQKLESQNPKVIVN